MTDASSILWVNGPFGGGKTSACRALRCLDPRWRLADPEILGTYLRDAEATHGQDFQEHPGWTRLVVAGLLALEPSPDRPVAVSMAILNEQTWDAIEGGLTSDGLGCSHVVLDADAAELARRIESAFVAPGEERGSTGVRQFRLARLAAYQEALGWLRTRATIFDTTSTAPGEVATMLLFASRTTDGTQPGPRR